MDANATNSIDNHETMCTHCKSTIRSHSAAIGNSPKDHLMPMTSPDQDKSLSAMSPKNTLPNTRKLHCFDSQVQYKSKRHSLTAREYSTALAAITSTPSIRTPSREANQHTPKERVIHSQRTRHYATSKDLAPAATTSDGFTPVSTASAGVVAEVGDVGTVARDGAADAVAGDSGPGRAFSVPKKVEYPPAARVSVGPLAQIKRKPPTL